MKKIKALFFLLLYIIAGCALQSVPSIVIGDWNCQPYASDHYTDTSFYALHIEKDGTFSLYDKVGNPGIDGMLKDIGDSEFEIKCNTEDFDPPFCWKLKDEDILQYEIINKNQIRLYHNNIYLEFTRN